MSTTRLLIIITSVALAGLILYGITGRGPEGSAAAAAPAPTVPAAPPPAAEIPMPPAHEIYNADRRQREEAARQIEHMRQLQTARQQREAAGNLTRQQWEELRMRNEWKMVNLVRTNMAGFLALKQEANKRPEREVTCKFCGGDAMLDLCVICDGSGKCPTCGGVGRERIEPDRPCPTCEGRKKCFLCAGRRKMPCNFCERGKITNIAPPPSTLVGLP
jgi:hypothetical protein